MNIMAIIMKLLDILPNVLTIGHSAKNKQLDKHREEIKQLSNIASQSLKIAQAAPQWIHISAFDLNDKDFLAEMEAIYAKPEFQYFLYNTREKIIRMEQDGDENVQKICRGMLKCFTMIQNDLQNLSAQAKAGEVKQ